MIAAGYDHLEAQCVHIPHSQGLPAERERRAKIGSPGVHTAIPAVGTPYERAENRKPKMLSHLEWREKEEEGE
jgi:hypothetical protein